MTDKNKYDLFLEEISSLEKLIYLFAQKSDDLAVENDSLLKRINELEKENSILKQKINDFELKLAHPFAEDDLFANLGSINSEDRDVLKNKINDLIKKIDSHLRS